MTGKDKCQNLKQIRRQIAEANGIPMEIPDCTYEGDCPGTCPRCEQELRLLKQALEAKRARGEVVVIPLTKVRAVKAQIPLSDDEAEEGAPPIRRRWWGKRDWGCTPGVPAQKDWTTERPKRRRRSE